MHPAIRRLRRLDRQASALLVVAVVLFGVAITLLVALVWVNAQGGAP